MVKNPPAKRLGRCEFNPWVGKIPWRRKWQPTPIFLPRNSHGQRSLAGYSPWGHNESDMTEHAHTYAHSIKKKNKQKERLRMTSKLN